MPESFSIEPHRLRINHAGHTVCSQSWSWRTDRQSWQDLDLWVVMHGGGYLHSPLGRLPLQRGSTWLLRGGEVYAGERDPQQGLVVSFTHFDLLDEQGAVMPWQTLNLPPHYRRITPMNCFEGLLQHLLSAERQQPGGLHGRIWLSAALALVMEQDQNDRNPSPSSEVEQAIMACVNELRESPTRWSSVAAMAAHYHYSADHFSRAFKQRLGLSPAQFLIEVRLEHARNLLRYTNLSASQIAQELGFADPAYFSRVFTRHHRISPGAWRRHDHGD